VKLFYVYDVSTFILLIENSSNWRFLIGLQGEPAHIIHLGKSDRTNDLAATTEPQPIVQPGITIVSAAIQT
jgi:hypothetical protein